MGSAAASWRHRARAAATFAWAAEQHLSRTRLRGALAAAVAVVAAGLGVATVETSQYGMGGRWCAGAKRWRGELLGDSVREDWEGGGVGRQALPAQWCVAVWVG